MKNKIYFLLILLQISCSNKSQNKFTFDKMPLDTTKWCATDTILIDLNQDKIKDVILVFDKYRGMVRPDDIQTLILFYLGKKDFKYSFISKAEKIIYSPYYKIIKKNNGFYIQQESMDDYKISQTFFKYENGFIVAYKEIIIQKIEKGIIDENTGEVITTSVKIDTISNQNINILADEYNFNRLIR
ncbi:hypothetical protein [Tenuifilum osseticum]|uniref:hypothetical protein n=1 Tax=Tenuifilum osseticum TaxID=3374723 RepID=UPI0034E423C3